MSVKDTSIIALEELRKTSMGKDQQAVFEALLEIGPTHDQKIMEYLNQQEQTKRREERRLWTINNITGRRNQLIDKGIVHGMGPYRVQWYGKEKTYHIWSLRYDSRSPIGIAGVMCSDAEHKARKAAKRQKRIDELKRQFEQTGPSSKLGPGLFNQFAGV